MRLKRYVVAFFILQVLAAAGGKIDPASSTRQSDEAYLEKLDSVPDLTQTDPNGKLPGGGIFYCAPVAISNSLVWLADNGFDNLMPDIADRTLAQFEMARQLGTRRYMNTSLETGSNTQEVLRGVYRYLIDKGYKNFWIEYQGWCRHPRLFGTRVDIPEVSWIKQGLKGDSVVWLNAGWYRYIPSKKYYYRFGEHWLTLVGYGVDKMGNKNPDILIVHDPAPRAGKKASHTYIKLQRLNSGQLVGTQDGLPRLAKGYYLLAGDMRINRRADFAILDGAVVLRMKKKAVKALRRGRGVSGGPYR